MSDPTPPPRIKTIQISGFRGVPPLRLRETPLEIKLNSNNLLLCGPNGSGKSTIADGIEFLLSGTVERFGRSKTRAVPHISAKSGETEVSITLEPAGKISLSRFPLSTTVEKKDSGVDFCNQHKDPKAIILRRSQILDFIRQQPKDRWIRYASLIGLEHLSGLSAAFATAEKQAESAHDEAQKALAAKLKLVMGSLELEVSNTKQLLRALKVLLSKQEIEVATTWEGMANAIEILNDRMPTDMAEQLKLVFSLQSALTQSLPGTSPVEFLDSLVECNLEVESQLAKTEDSKSQKIIELGLAYFRDDKPKSCPLCQQSLPAVEGQPFTPEEVFAALEERDNNHNKLKAAQAKQDLAAEEFSKALERYNVYLRGLVDNSTLLSPESLEVIERFQAHCTQLKQLDRKLTAPPNECALIKADCRSLLSIVVEEKRKLAKKEQVFVAASSGNSASLLGALERSVKQKKDLSASSKRIVEGQALHQKAKLVNSAFTCARETALRVVFQDIQKLVMKYYEFLHQTACEIAAVEMKPDSRSATGGLSLAVNFFDTDPSVPELYLSDGHLDSLGICIWLATAARYNPSGSILVLDDVLTSIDRGHRSRFNLLLNREFNDSQLIITTHDAEWFKEWRFRFRTTGIKGWTYLELGKWDVHFGPTLRPDGEMFTWLTHKVNSDEYRFVGGPLRIVTEDFVKDVAHYLKIEIPFNRNGHVELGGLVQNSGKELRKFLLKHSNEIGVGELEVTEALALSLGSSLTTNMFVHQNWCTDNVPQNELIDFVNGLTKLRDWYGKCPKN